MAAAVVSKLTVQVSDNVGMLIKPFQEVSISASELDRRCSTVLKKAIELHSLGLLSKEEQKDLSKARRIDLSKVEFTDKELIEVGSLCPEIEALDLSECQKLNVTNLYNVPIRLKVLYVRGCNGFTSLQLNIFQSKACSGRLLIIQ